MNKFFPTISVQRVNVEFFQQRIGSVLATSHRLTASVDVKHFINLICINSLPLLLVGSFR